MPQDSVDGFVQVQPDVPTGKKVDTSELTRKDADSTVVERERGVIADGDTAGAATAAVRGEQGRGVVGSFDVEVLAALTAMNGTLSEIRDLLMELK